MKKQITLTLCCLTLFALFTAHAQQSIIRSNDCITEDIIIGTGDVGTYEIPINTFYNYSYVQQVFLADELEINSGDSIYEVAFQYIYNISQGPDGKTNQTVYLGNTNKNSFSGVTDWIPVAQLQEVFSGTVQYNNSQPEYWCSITFDNKFVYSGGNLVVAVLNNHGDFNTGSNPTFQMHNNTSGLRTLPAHVDVGPIVPEDPPPATSPAGFRNNIKFGICKSSTHISGTVMHNDLTAVKKGYVSLYQIKSTGYYTLIETVLIENNGNYMFTQVEDGNYVVQAKPDNSENALPTYYGNTEYWDLATIVTIAGGVSKESIDIVVIPSDFIMDGTSCINVFTVDGGKGPSEGEDVYIQIGEQGDIWKTVGSGTTDANGFFAFGDLPAGTYKVIVDKPGLVIDPFISKPLLEKDTAIVVFVIPILGIHDFSIEELIKVYPNPTTGVLTITRGHAPLPSYELQVTSVEIFDIYGRKLAPHTSYLTPHTSFDISHFSAGVYFVRIKTDK